MKDEVLNLASNVICDDEGYVDHVYPDNLGIPTCGIGFAVKDLTDIEKNILGESPYTKENCLKVLALKLSSVYDQLSHAIGFFTTLSNMRQVALLDLAYQIGVHGLLCYKHMLVDLKIGDIKQAAIDEMDSLEAKQTPNRAKHIRDLILQG